MYRVSILLVLALGLICAVPDTSIGDDRYIFDDQTQQWTAADQPVNRPQGPLGQARELIDAAEYRKAEMVLSKYIEANDDTQDRAAAMLLYADCAFMRGRYYKANGRYQRVIEEYPQTDQFAISLRRQLDIAGAWLEGRKRRLVGIIPVRADGEALDLLGHIEQMGTGHRIAEVAVRMMADYYFRTGQYELAELHYRRLIKDYHSAKYTKMAMSRTAASALAMFPGVSFDQTPLLEAKELYTEYLERFPGHAKKEGVQTILADIDRKRAEKEYQVGRFYVRIGKPQAAAYYFNYVLKTWPDTIWADRAGEELDRLGFERHGAVGSTVKR